MALLFSMSLSTCCTKSEEEDLEDAVRSLFGRWGEVRRWEGGVAPDTLCFGLQLMTANLSVKKFHLLLL